MNIREFLNKHNVEWVAEGHKHVRPGWIGLDCPQCGPRSHKFHLGYNIEKGYTFCWKCGPLRLYDVLTALTGLTYKQAKDEFGEVDRNPNRDNTLQLAQRKLVMPPGLMDKLSKVHRNYLRQRKLDPDEVQMTWGLKGIGPVGDYKWRIFIPVYYNEVLVSWTTRSIRPRDKKRYWSASEEQEAVPHKHLLFGADLARHAIIVTEGPFDAIRIGPGGVATFGQTVMQAQVDKMTDYPIRVICFDSTPDAQTRARRLATKLEAFPGQTYVVKLNAKDAAAADQSEIKELRNRFLR